MIWLCQWQFTTSQGIAATEAHSFIVWSGPTNGTVTSLVRLDFGIFHYYLIEDYQMSLLQPNLAYKIASSETYWISQ
jgi:hypothetical protein